MKIYSLNDNDLSTDVEPREIYQGTPTDIETNQEYYDDIRNFYTEKFDENVSGQLVPMIQQGEQMAAQLSRNGKTYLQRSDSGNVTIKWIESPDAVYLLGIISKTGKLNRGDVRSFNEWIERLLDALEDGKTLLTSPNRYVSKAVLSTVVKAARERGFDLEMQKHDAFEMGDSPYLQWENIMVRKQGSPRMTHRPQLR